MREGPPRTLRTEKKDAVPPVEAAVVEGVEAVSPQLREGSYCLTKIAHMLMRGAVPDIDDLVEEGEFTREGIAYPVPPPDGDDVVDPADTEERGKKIATICNQLEKYGLTIRVDPAYQSYAAVDGGDIQYVKTLVPWEVFSSSTGQPKLLFKPKTLKKKILRSKTLTLEEKESCTEYLANILKLFKEEEVEQERKRKERLRLPDADIQEIEDLLATINATYLKALHGILTGDEAEKSEVRKAAIVLCNDIFRRLKVLREETKATPEQHDPLSERFEELNRAIGLINNGVVDHTRR